MKKLFILLACAATMVACSKDEALEVNKGEAIAFGNPFVGKVTKADVPTYGVGGKKITAFNVWGTVNGAPIYAGTTVTGTVGGNWAAAGDPQYWAAGAAYKFAAIVDGPTPNTVPLVNGLPETISYTQADQLDLLYAENNTVTSASAEQGPVNFQFSHLLSKVKFTVTTNIAAEGYSHVVEAIKVDNFTTGTYTVDGGTWAGATDKEVGFNTITVNKDNKTAVNDAVLLIPNAADFNVSFTVKFKKGETVIWEQDYDETISQDLVKGHGYNFTIGLSAGNQIKFTVNNDPTAWIENDSTTTPIIP